MHCRKRVLTVGQQESFQGIAVAKEAIYVVRKRPNPDIGQYYSSTPSLKQMIILTIHRDQAVLVVARLGYSYLWLWKHEIPFSDSVTKPRVGKWYFKGWMGHQQQVGKIMCFPTPSYMDWIWDRKEEGSYCNATTYILCLPNSSHNSVWLHSSVTESISLAKFFSLTCWRIQW